MAQIIKHRRGSITQLKDVTARIGELVVATGSISDLNGPMVFVGETEGVAGAYRPLSKIYQGTSAPTITLGSHGSIIDGTPFYATGNKTLYILSKDGNTDIDLTGNIEGNVISGVTINSLTGSIINISSNLTVGGNTALSGDLFITGNTFQTGNISLTGDLTLGGNISIGDQDTDNIFFGGEISSSIVPDVHNAFDLGSSSKNWRNLHVSGTAYVNILEAGEISLDGITVFEDLVVSGSSYLGSGGGDQVVVSGSIYNDALTDNRVVIVGAQGLIEDDANFTFDGTELNVGQGNFTVQQDNGNTSVGGTLNIKGSTVYTFNVSNDGSSNYIINGESDPTLTVVEGQTYTFVVNASGHPFYIKTVSSTGTGNAYNDGVTNNGTDNGTITFVVPYNAPSTLYYNCQFHASMAGTINVIKNTLIVTGSATLKDNLEVKGATGLNSSLNVTGSVTLKDTLEVKGATGLNSTLTVTGSATLKDTLEVKGATGLNSTLTVTGSATLKDNLSVSGTTTVSGATILQNTLQVNSTSELKGAVGINSTLDVTGSAQFKDTINVDGEATLSSATVEDLTQDRIVTVGAGGSLIDSSGFTYNGTVFKIGNGQFEVDTNDGDVRTSGSLIVEGGQTVNGDVTVNGVLTVTGNTQLQANLYISGNLEVLGGATSVIIQSTTVELDDNIIRLNAYSPFERYAGFEVIDSGSSGVSASLVWDGLNDYWMFVSSSGESSKLLGTTAGTYGSETSLTDTYFPIATGPNTIGDSLLRYSGTTLSFNTNKFTIDSGTGDTLVSGNFTLSYSGGTDNGNNTSAIMFRNSSNVVGFISTTETTDVLDGILGYKNSDGALVFSTVIDGGSY
jgi:plastocyanin